MTVLTRRERTRLLVLSPPELARELAQEVRALHLVEVLEPARAGLVMAQVLETARRSVFHLGEVLVSECKVRVSGTLGLGLVKGWNEDLAEDLAVVDAAYRAGLPVTEGWNGRLDDAGTALEARLADERRLLETTRVDFQTMDTGA
ncbi:MAG: phosphonate C-P lyase system protein PhnG [Spirochaetales bacterium]